MSDLNTLLTADKAGAYETANTGVDAFVRAKNAKGFGWMDVKAFRPVEKRRTRCQHEVFCHYDDIAVSDSTHMAPSLVVFG